MRGLVFDIASGWEDHDIIVLSPRADVTRWANTPPDRKVIVDLPDSFLDEGRGLKRSARGLAKWAAGEISRPVGSYLRAVERLLRRADAVVCSTDEQAARLALHNRNVHPILDLHDELEFRAPRLRLSDQLDIVWEGLTSTLSAMGPVLPALRTLAREQEVRLHLVTDLSSPRFMNRFLVRQTEDLVADWGIDVRLYQWSIDALTEVSDR